MTIKEIQDEIVEEFSLFENWMERYEYMIELGKTIELISPSNKTWNKINSILDRFI